MKKQLTCFAFILSLCISGCVQVNPVDENRVNQIAVSSVHDFPMNYSKGASFNLVPRFVPQFEQLDANKRKNITVFYELFAKAIIADLQAKGFVYSSTGKADFSVGYGLALDKDFNDEQINDKFGVMPGLIAADDLEKGSFIIYIEDSAMAKRVWRGAVQGFVQEGSSEQERHQRVTKMVNTVLSQFIALE